MKVINIRNVPEDVHATIKMAAAAKRMSMQEYVITTMAEASAGVSVNFVKASKNEK